MLVALSESSSYLTNQMSMTSTSQHQVSKQKAQSRFLFMDRLQLSLHRRKNLWTQQGKNKIHCHQVEAKSEGEKDRCDNREEPGKVCASVFRGPQVCPGLRNDYLSEVKKPILGRSLCVGHNLFRQQAWLEKVLYLLKLIWQREAEVKQVVGL